MISSGEKTCLDSIKERIIQNYEEGSDKGYILKVNVNYRKELHKLYSDLPLLPEKMEADMREKIICNLYNKKNYIIYIRALNQALDYGLILENAYSWTEFNEEAWLKQYIDMNAELRTKTRNDFEKTVESKEAPQHQTCDNSQKKNLPSVRAKLS